MRRINKSCGIRERLFEDDDKWSMQIEQKLFALGFIEAWR
jgi:hypothetical protein